MSLLSRCKRLFRRPHLRLIALVGVIVPRRLRANWRQEWEAELRHREAMLAEWDRLDWRAKLDLLRRSTSAFWDALWLQPKRLEDEMFQDLRFGVGGDPQVLGRSITLDDKIYSIIGVTPADFRFFPDGELEIIKPGAPSPEMSKHYHRQWETFYMIARLKPGVTFGQAQADMKAVTERIRQQNPGWYPPESQWSLAAQPLQEYFFGDLRRPLFLLWGAVGLVLLIACANVANLALARATSRRKEFSVRLAVGANRFRLMRQLLTESVMLALIGGGLGCLLALWGISALVALEPTKVFQAVRVKADGAVLWFSLGVSLLTGVMFGLFPAIRYSKANLAEAIKEGARSASERFRLRSPKSILVVAEVALSLLLLIGAGLLLRSFDKVLRVNPGFEPQGLLAFVTLLPELRYKTNAQINSFYQQAFADIKAIPGVEAVGSTSNPPLSGSVARNIFAIEGQKYGPAQKPSGTVSAVTPGYFQTMKIPLLAGRYFTEQDTAGAPKVVIIDELLAQRHFAGQRPIGQRISIGNDTWREIIGVVGHVKHDGLDEFPGVAQYYYPTFQGDMETGQAVVIRSRSDPLTLVPAVRDAIQKIDKDQPIYLVRTLTQNLRDITAQRRFLVLLLSIFAGTALALAAIGLSGMIAYSVSQRTHEIGIRMALGARASDVLRLIIGQGLKLILVGVALGLAGALAQARLLADLLFDVKPTDPITFAFVPLLLVGVALLASYLPARRATKVDPMVTLRHE
jgi:putative ABC transport system permease protein